MGQITGKQSDTKEYMRSSEKKEATPSLEAAQDTLASGLVPGTLVESITLEKGCNCQRIGQAMWLASESTKELSVWERSTQTSQNQAWAWRMLKQRRILSQRRTASTLGSSSDYLGR